MSLTLATGPGQIGASSNAMMATHLAPMGFTARPMPNSWSLGGHNSLALRSPGDNAVWQALMVDRSTQFSLQKFKLVSYVGLLEWRVCESL